MEWRQQQQRQKRRRRQPTGEKLVEFSHNFINRHMLHNHISYNVLAENNTKVLSEKMARWSMNKHWDQRKGKKRPAERNKRKKDASKYSEAFQKWCIKNIYRIIDVKTFIRSRYQNMKSTMQMTNSYSKGFAYVECLSSWVEHRELAPSFCFPFSDRETTWETQQTVNS